ncbi:MAG: 50S ribosomal protein L24e [Candidatus Pacearchaeota archaeon]
MTKCVFCGKEEHAFKGVNLIANDGTINYYCSSKCRRNALKLKRDKKKLKWTEAYRIAKNKAEKTEKINAEAKKEEKK